jgi:hypothetical protein
MGGDKGEGDIYAAAAVAVAIQEQGGLAHAVNDALGQDLSRRRAQTSEGGEQIGLVNDLSDRLSGLDRTESPPGACDSRDRAADGKIGKNGQDSGDQ